MAKLGKELINDSTTNIKSDALREIGKAHEMTMNRWCFTRLVDFCGVTVGLAASGSDVTNMIDGVLMAQAKVGEYGFMADTAVLWPYAWYLCFSKLIPMYNEGAMSQVEGKRQLAYGGMNFLKCGVTAGAAYEIPDVATAYKRGWGTASTTKAASSVGALVFEKDRCGELGILEEMELEEFDDPIKYLINPIANTRWDFRCAKDPDLTGRTNANSVGCVYSHS